MMERSSLQGLRIRVLRVLQAGVLTVAVVLLAACRGEDPARSAQSSVSQSEQHESAASISLPDGALAQLWADIRGTDVGDADLDAAPIQFPADLVPHPKALAETLKLRAVLTRDDGKLVAVQSQLNRLDLGIEAVATSAWGFSELMRASVSVGVQGQDRQQFHEAVQRRALGLADSTSEAMHVDSTRLSYSSSQGAESPCAGRYELDTLLPGRFVTANSSVVQESLPTARMQMQIAMTQCPEPQSLQGLRQWQASALAVSAQVFDRGSEQISSQDSDQISGAQWQGHAWISSVWGNLPGMGGAVLIDQAQLRLQLASENGTSSETDAVSETETASKAETAGDTSESEILLSVSRSKRRSGRGPRTVQASLEDAAGQRRSVELSWTDQGAQFSATSQLAYPQKFQLQSQDQSIILLLTPLVSLPEINDALGVRWSGAVSVSGSHTGVGFVDFQPLESALNSTSGES